MTAHDCSASVVLRASDAQLTEGQDGFVDLFFEVPSGTYNLAAYTIQVELEGDPAGVRFTAAGLPPNNLLLGEWWAFDPPSIDDHAVSATDVLLSEFERPITDGSGLIRLFFQTDVGSAGTYTVAVNQDLVLTSFSDGVGNPLFVDASPDWAAISFEPGALTVRALSDASIPEPSGLLIWLVLGPAACGLARHYRRK